LRCCAEKGEISDLPQVTGVALIAIQSTLTAALAILLAINAIVVMCKDNPHERRRREIEERRQMDARNSLVLGKGAHGHDGKGYYQTTPTQDTFFPIEQQGSSQYPMQPMSRHDPYGGLAPYHERSPSAGTLSRQSLISSAAPPADHVPGQHDSYRGYGRGY